MTDTDARFDRLEAGLDKVGGRLDKVEGRLENVEDQVNGLRADVTGLTSRVGKLEHEVQKLRVLGEESTQQIKLMAEVQSHHGTVLEQLVKDVQPLKAVPDLLRTAIQNHEKRITALETRGDVRG